MANKRNNKKRYTQVLKPVKGSNRKVNCYKCGTNNGYSLEDMIEHKSWCALAQAKAKAATRQREALAREPTDADRPAQTTTALARSGAHQFKIRNSWLSLLLVLAVVVVSAAVVLSG